MSNKIAQVKLLLEKAKDGKVFTVDFTKKDGSPRTMNARLGVKKGVKGVGQKYSPSDYNLLTVFDMQKAAFRNIGLESISRVTIAGETILFTE